MKKIPLRILQYLVLALLSFQMLPVLAIEAITNYEQENTELILEEEALYGQALYEKLMKLTPEEQENLRRTLNVEQLESLLEFEEIQQTQTENVEENTTTETENQSSEFYPVQLPDPLYQARALTQEDEELVVNKTATYNEATGNVDIQLEAYSKGRIEMSSVENISVLVRLTNKFDFPTSSDGQADISSLKVYKNWSYQKGMPPSPHSLISTVKDREIQISGIDLEPVIFDQNNQPTEVTKNNKLIIRFSIIPKASFFGGNDVKTNENVSGVYTENNIGEKKLLKAFPVPSINIPTKPLTLVKKDKKMYVGQLLDLHDFIQNIDEINGENNSHVEIQLNITSTDKQWAYTFLPNQTLPAIDLSQVDNPQNDQTFEISYTIRPVSPSLIGESVPDKKDDFSGNIYRFYPEVLGTSKKGYLGKELNLQTSDISIHSWKHPKSEELTHLAFDNPAPILDHVLFNNPPATYLTDQLVETQKIYLKNEGSDTLTELDRTNLLKYSNQPDTQLYVFKPTVQSSNLRVGYGSETRIHERRVSTTWNHPTENKDGLPAPPELVFKGIHSTLNTEHTIRRMKQDEHYKWQVSMDGKDYTQQVTFVNNDYPESDTKSRNTNNNHFSIFVDFTEIILEKNRLGANSASWGTESFIFEIVWTNDTEREVYYETLSFDSLDATKQKKMTRMKPGTYVVQEIENWSSRYQASSPVIKEVDINSSETFSFQNNLIKETGLTYESQLNNLFFEKQ